jgi:type IV pilus assembly protein PilM
MSVVLGGTTSFFGLDIGTTAIRLVELRGGSSPKALVKYAYIPVDSKLALSDSKADQLKLAKVISQLVGEARPTTKNVAVGIPSSRVFTTVADVDRLPANELAKAINYQADSLIPTPLTESKIDWSLIGDSPSDKTKQEILLTSVPNNFVESRLDMLETIGLNVIAFEPDNLAIARSLSTADSGAQLILDMGNKSTDLVIVLNDVPHLTRNIPTGVEAIIKATQENLNIDDKQASQFVYKFGLNKEKLEGQIFQAVSGTVDVLIGEIEKSIKFFNNRYTGVNLDKVIVTGGTSVIPEFPLYIANKFNLNVEIGNPWKKVTYNASRQNELLTNANQFSVAIGLAERQE